MSEEHHIQIKVKKGGLRVSAQVNPENQTEQKKGNGKKKKKEQILKTGIQCYYTIFFLREREDPKKYGKMLTFLKPGL